jgi:hypothetical protein
VISSNPTFMSRVNHERNLFIELLYAANINSMVYPSKHFFERLVERNLEAVDALRMLAPVIKDFRETTYNLRSYAVRWKNFSLFALIDTGPVTGVRRIVLKTIYDRDVLDTDYDVVVRI